MQPPLPVRTAVIFMFAIMCGVGIGALMKCSGQSWAASVIAGLVAAGASSIGANTLIGP